MKRALAQISYTFCVALVLVGLAKCQVAIGTPRFSDLGGGPFDRVNLGNLNVHFVVPILQKAGRGAPFNYNLTYDGSVWQPVTSGSTKSWANITNTTWGWTSSIPRGGQARALSISFNSEIVPCGPNGLQKTETTTTYSNWVYIDGFGTSHPFPGSSQTMSGCTSSSTGFVSPDASDSSGYRMSVNGARVTALFAADGASINPATGAVTLQDSNGNEITSTSSSGTTTYTDTLGTSVLTVSGSGTPISPITYQYTSPNGGAAEDTVQYTSYTVKTNFGLNGITEYGPTANSLVSAIQLPDGSSYSFTYEQTPGSCTPLSQTFASYCITGRIASVTLPTGGTVTYLYSGGPNNTGIFGDGSTAGLKRILTASTTCSASTSCWQYSRALVSGTPGPGSTWTTTVTDPNGNNTVLNFAEDTKTTAATYNLYQTQGKVYQGSSATGTLLGTNITCYNANFTNCATATVSSPITEKDFYTQLPNASTGLSQTLYNSAGLVTDDKEYDYGVVMGAAPTTAHRIKQTAITYASLGNIINGPATVVVSDWTSGSAVTLSSATYTYDQTTPTATSATPQHVSVTGSRGNLTTLATKTNSTTTLSRTFTHYDTGTPNVATDVNGAQTTYVYGTATQGSSTVSCGNSFPTTLNEPLSLSRTVVWDCAGGVSTQVTDENQKIVTSTYTDPNFWRPASLTDQLSNQTNLSYFGQTAVEAALQNFNGGSSASDSRSTIDGFGRPILSQKLQAPGASNYDTVETDYNNVGLPQRATMPFIATAGTTNSSAPGTITTYDALGRVLTVTDAAGGQVSYSYTNNDVKQTVSGTQSFQKQLEYDGLGRLTSVCEMTQATGSGTCGQSNQVNGFWTKYTYDALGRLLTVAQNAQAATANRQTRSFAHDMLGRMTSETNPEGGTTTYVFDTESSACGSITRLGDLVLKTDANGNITCYYHDALHRLVHESTVAGSGPNPTPDRFFVYDSATVNGVAMANAKGHLAEAYTCNTCTGAHLTDEGFSYSARGEVADVYESTPNSGGYYHTTAAYWPTGTLRTLSGIPGVPTINYGAANGAGLDGEGRVTAVTTSGTNPVSSVTYSPSSTTNFLGALTRVTFGSGDSDSFTYDPNTGRMQSYSFAVSGTTDAGTLTWNSNGTLATLAVNDQIPGTADSQTCNYSYDDLQRVSSVNCGTLWTQNFSYDTTGNVSKSVPSGDGGLSFLPTYSTTPPTNRFTAIPGVSVSYDAAGNLLRDNLNTYTWDADGKMLNVGSGSTTISATYDALDRMVEQQNGSAHAEILYSPVGKTALLNGQALTKGFIPLPGGATAVYNSSGLAYYRHSDWLGSSRLSSTQARALFSSSAYAPFGERYGTAGTADASYTGQNSDTVTSLYDFLLREHSPSQGRWISPDPAGLMAADPSNPQSWNRYAYVLNNPLSYTDPLGLECVWDDGSYDSAFDSQTGSVGGCSDAGGTWVELGQNGNWSGQADQWNQNLVASIQAGQVGQVDILGQNGFTYQTMYNGGQTTETVTPDATTFYSYGQPVTSVSQMIDTALCGLCHSNNFVSIFTPQQIQQFALTHRWSRDFFDPLHKNWWNGGLQLRSDDTTCSTHMSIDLSASAAMGGSVGDWHVDQGNWMSWNPLGALIHMEEVATGGTIVEGPLAEGVGCSK